MLEVRAVVADLREPDRSLSCQTAESEDELEAIALRPNALHAVFGEAPVDAAILPFQPFEPYPFRVDANRVPREPPASAAWKFGRPSHVLPPAFH